MEESLKFNSQVCTNLQQSKRLLELGLKPETADIVIRPDNTLIIINENSFIYHNLEKAIQEEYFPAWSLHRLIELIPQDIHLDDYADTHYYLVIKPSRVLYLNDYKEWLYYNDDTNYYNRLIDCIRWTIEQKLFNKEYLKQ